MVNRNIPENKAVDWLDWNLRLNRRTCILLVFLNVMEKTCTVWSYEKYACKIKYIYPSIWHKNEIQLHLLETTSTSRFLFVSNHVTFTTIQIKKKNLRIVLAVVSSLATNWFSHTISSVYKWYILTSTPLHYLNLKTNEICIVAKLYQRSYDHLLGASNTLRNHIHVYSNSILDIRKIIQIDRHDLGGVL